MVDVQGRFLLLNAEAVTVTLPPGSSLRQWKEALHDLPEFRDAVPSHYWLEILEDDEPVTENSFADAGGFVFDGADAPSYRVMCLRVPDMGPVVNAVTEAVGGGRIKLEFFDQIWGIYRDKIKPTYEPDAHYEKYGKAGWWFRFLEFFRDRAQISHFELVLRGEPWDALWSQSGSVHWGEFLQWMSSDRSAAVLLCSAEDSLFEVLPAALRADKEIATAAVLGCEYPRPYHSFALEHVVGDLRRDREFCLKALRRGRGLLEHVSAEFCADREVVMQALRNCEFWSAPRQFRCATEDLRADREVLRTAIESNPACLIEAQAEFRDDKKMVLAALLGVSKLEPSQEKMSYMKFYIEAFASARLREDPDVISATRVARDAIEEWMDSVEEREA